MSEAKNMIYFKRFKEPDAEPKEVTYDEALKTLLGSYLDNEDVRGLLDYPNTIKCMFSILYVVENNADDIKAILSL